MRPDNIKNVTEAECMQMIDQLTKKSIVVFAKFEGECFKSVVNSPAKYAHTSDECMQWCSQLLIVRLFLFPLYEQSARMEKCNKRSNGQPEYPKCEVSDLQFGNGRIDDLFVWHFRSGKGV